MTNVLVAIAMTLLLATAFQGIFGYRLPGLALAGIYVALWLPLKSWQQARRAAEYGEPTAPDAPDWPGSGPIGRLGGRAVLLPWTLTSLLTVLNPVQLWQQLQQSIGNAALKARAKRSGDDGVGYRTKATYTLPFDGEWCVLAGGMTPRTSHSWDLLGQRFALDFAQADAARVRHTGRGTRPEEYHCYGREILAAADGTVSRVESRIGIAPLLGWGVCDFTARSAVGNHVVIQHAEGEYALYAHLIEGSVAVEPGESVARGQVIGRCGHTGHSSEPHLHFHLTDSSELFSGMGLPVRFSELVVDGQEVDARHLTAGNRVCRRPATLRAGARAGGR